MTFRIQVRVIGATVPAAASGSTPARMTSAACRNSISAAWTNDKTIAISPKTTTAAAAALPPSCSAAVSRWVNWPPVETWRIHADQASPAFSSSAGIATPRVATAARVTRPPVTSSSGTARRVIAIRAPAAMTLPAAMAAVTGSSQACSWEIAGSDVRSGDGMPIHNVAVFDHAPADAVADRAGDAGQDVPGRRGRGGLHQAGYLQQQAGRLGEGVADRGHRGSPFAGEDRVAGQG